MIRNYGSRKFLIACTFTATGIMALFSGHLNGGEFVALATIVLGLYSAADVVQHKVYADVQK